MDFCKAKGCKEKLNILSTQCKFCNLKFCLKHRTPESHSSECTDKARLTLQKQYKKESAQIKHLQEKKGVSVVSMRDVEKDHSEARKRLAESIRKKQAERKPVKK